MNIPHTFLKKFNWKVNGKFLGFSSSPEADWKVILIITMILIVIIIASNIFLFMKINKGEIFMIEKVVEPEAITLDLSVLRATVAYYQDKALEFERIKNTLPSTTDPSL